MDVNKADDLVRKYKDAVVIWALTRDASDRSGGTRNLWEPLVERAERARDEAAADIRRALTNAR